MYIPTDVLYMYEFPQISYTSTQENVKNYEQEKVKDSIAAEKIRAAMLLLLLLRMNSISFYFSFVLGFCLLHSEEKGEI